MKRWQVWYKFILALPANFLRLLFASAGFAVVTRAEDEDAATRDQLWCADDCEDCPPAESDEAALPSKSKSKPSVRIR